MDGKQVADEAGFAQHLDGLRAAANRMTASADEADDLVQDCLASAVQGAGRVRNAGLLGAWLHQILRRRWYDQLRRRAVERRYLREGRQAAVPRDPAEAGSEIVRRALHNLDPDTRRVLEMRFFESRTSVDIGRKLGKSSGTVRSMIFHALRKFEYEFNRFCPKENT